MTDLTMLSAVFIVVQLTPVPSESHLQSLQLLMSVSFKKQKQEVPALKSTFKKCRKLNARKERIKACDPG